MDKISLKSILWWFTPSNQQDEFLGSSWGAKPTPDWNTSTFWNDYYRDLLGESDAWRRERVIHREVELLIRMLTQVGELPAQDSSPLLEAGCGISLIPHVLAYWGFQVTGIDLCPRAIEVASRHQPDEEELARCVPIWDRCQDFPNSYELVKDPARSLQRLRSFQASGGSMSYHATDWFAEVLTPGSFGVIYCRNSLRCSTKSYWRRSLCQFQDLLEPGGVLLLENVNAIGIQDEVEELLEECQFVPITTDASRELAHKYVLSMWPTG